MLVLKRRPIEDVLLSPAHVAEVKALRLVADKARGLMSLDYFWRGHASLPGEVDDLVEALAALDGVK